MSVRSFSTAARDLRTILLASVALVVVVASGCSQSDELIAASDAPVLVTIDPKFLDTLEFTVADAANNYVVRSNSSPEYDPDVDPLLSIESYQVNDVTTWATANQQEEPKIQAALASVITDVLPPQGNGRCTAISQTPAVFECIYDVGQVEPMPMLVRRFDDTTMILIGNQAQGVDYISGVFDTITPTEASTTFPRD